VAETSLARGLAARSSRKREICWHCHGSRFRLLMHCAGYSELVGPARQGVGVSLLSSCEDDERYYVSYLPDFGRSSDSTMAKEPRA